MIARRVLPFFALLFSGLGALAGPPATIKATLTELAPRPRQAAPEWVEVTLNSRSTAIREGALEFTMNEWGASIYRYRTHDLVLNSGDQRFRFMLPTATSVGANSTRELELRFIEKGGTTYLGEFPLIASQRGDAAHVIAVVRQNFRANGNDTYPLWQALRLERFAPETGPNFDTTPIFLDPADVPLDPLGFFPFDLVLIESDAFAKMRERARTALGQWVNAGGSLCIMADRGLEAEYVEELNRLAGADPQWKPITTDEAGRLRIPESTALARVNFGRLAVMSELPPETVEEMSPTWRKVSLFLWRLTSVQAAIIEKTGKWNLKSEEDVAPTDNYWERRRRYQVDADLRRLDAPISIIFPKSVRLVPLWILASVIGVFLVLVGPADWFILGALRRHRWTWFVFPIVAVLVTAGTLLLVQRFMGSSDRTAAIIVSDIGANGRVARETRIELELPASQEVATTSMKNALRLPVRINSYYRHWRSEWADLTFQGQYPSRFEYVRGQRQWSTEVSRVTTVVDEADTSGIKWDTFNPTFLEENQGVFQKILSPDYVGNENARVFDETIWKAAGLDERPGSSLSIFTKWGARRSKNRRPIDNWLRSLTVSPERPMFLFTHVSPSGFPSTDDLRILEPEDPSRTVIVAAVKEGDVIRVWRRLFLH